MCTHEKTHKNKSLPGNDDVEYGFFSYKITWGYNIFTIKSAKVQGH